MNEIECTRWGRVKVLKKCGSLSINKIGILMYNCTGKGAYSTPPFALDSDKADLSKGGHTPHVVLV